MVAVREHLAELTATGLEIVVVTFAAPRLLRGYQARFAPELTVVSDESLDAYRAFGLRRGSAWSVWGPKVIARYGRLLRAGRNGTGPKLGRPQLMGDPRQLGGDVVVDGDGRVSYIFRGTGPNDRPEIAALVAAVRATR